MNQHDTEHSEHEGHHVAPASDYYKVFGALLVLTVLTVSISRVPLGPFNMIVAMAVATVKALLVLGIFMQLRHDERLNATVFGFGLIFVSLFFIFTLADEFSRGFVDPVADNDYYAKDQIKQLKIELEKARGGVKYHVARPADYVPEGEVAAPPQFMPTPGAPGSEGAAPASAGAPGSEGAAPASAGAPGSAAAPASGAAAPASAGAPESAAAPASAAATASEAKPPKGAHKKAGAEAAPAH
jgi:cytochrome c oxidase subunit 4